MPAIVDQNEWQPTGRITYIQGRHRVNAVCWSESRSSRMEENRIVDLSCQHNRPGIGTILAVQCSAGRKGIDLTTLSPDQKPDRGASTTTPLTPGSATALLCYCITYTCTIQYCTSKQPSKHTAVFPRTTWFWNYPWQMIFFLTFFRVKVIEGKPV